MKKKPIYSSTWASAKLYELRKAEPRLEALCAYFERRLSGLGVKNPQDFLNARLTYLLRVKAITNQWNYLRTMIQYPDAWEKVFNQVIVPSTDKQQNGLFDV